jgi:hypothetical protein
LIVHVGKRRNAAWSTRRNDFTATRARRGRLVRLLAPARRARSR